MAPTWSCVAAGLAAVALQAPLAASLTDAEAQAVLNNHNQYRCMHNVTAFEWDDDLAFNAQNWANYINQTGNTTASVEIYRSAQLGDTSAFRATNYPVNTFTQALYSQISNTRNASGLANNITDTKNPSDSTVRISSYTQVVWASSVKLGCGLAYATVSARFGQIWICQYAPKGNVEGQFQSNVFAPVKTLAQCAGALNATNTARGTNGGTTTITTTVVGTTIAPTPGACVKVSADALRELERAKNVSAQRCTATPATRTTTPSSPTPSYTAPTPSYMAPSPSYAGQ